MGKRLLNRPVINSEPHVKSASFYVEVISPLTTVHRDTVKSDWLVGACVIRLLFWSTPFAVFWSVIAVIIDAINAMLERGFNAHVCEKVVETGFAEPPITNGYSASAIAVIFCMALAIAAAFHVMVRVVFGCFVVWDIHNILQKMLLQMKYVWQSFWKTRFGFDALATKVILT